MFGNRQRNEPDDGNDPGKAVEAKFTELETTVKALSENVVTKQDFQTIADTIKAMNEREEAKQKAIEAEKARKAAEQNQYDPSKAFNEFADDPRRVLQNATEPAARAAGLALARQAREDVLGEKEYYSGEFKRKVNQLIESSTNDPAQMANPAYMINCYNIVYAQMHQEGKLEAMRRAQGLHSFSDGQGTGGQNQDPTPKVEIRDSNQYSASKAKFAMSQLGLKDEDLIAAAKSGEIRGLEVVS